MNPVFSGLPNTIFDVMSGLARELDAINLGQGFPDDPGPEDVRRKAADGLLHGWNQYPPMMGLPELRQAIAMHYARFQAVDLDSTRETMVTSGATGRWLERYLPSCRRVMKLFCFSRCMTRISRWCCGPAECLAL